MQIKLSNDLSIWARRLALYFCLYVVIIGSHLFFSRFDLWHTDVDSARYMLSTLITSEAAIVALVVTLSLVAVQLAASSYSARVIDIFKRTPDLWILIGVYGIAIFYGLGVLKLIERVNPQVNSLSNLETHISFSYYLGIFAFMALGPYILNALNLLKPSTVINMLAEGITKEKTLSAIRDNGIRDIDSENDPIQPIIDLVRNSMMKYDYETVRDGLRAIGDRAEYIFENETFENGEEEKISEHIFCHFTRIGLLAGSRKDEYSIIEVITNIGVIGLITSELKLNVATLLAVESLEKIGMVAVDHKLEDATQRAAFYLGLIGESAVGHKFEHIAWRTAKLLGQIAEIAAKHKLEYTTRVVSLSLKLVGMATAKQQLRSASRKAVEYLEKVTKIATEYKLKDIAEQTEKSIKIIDETLNKLEQNKTLTPARNAWHSSLQLPVSS